MAKIKIVKNWRRLFKTITVIVSGSSGSAVLLAQYINDNVNTLDWLTPELKAKVLTVCMFIIFVGRFIDQSKSQRPEELK